MYDTVSYIVRHAPYPLASDPNHADLDVLADLIEADKVRTIIDRSYPLGEVPEAIRQLKAGHAPGKIVIAVHH
jgi:NADPH:quinone reductase-like Zn-dependent oxidoreductase